MAFRFHRIRSRRKDLYVSYFYIYFYIYNYYILYVYRISKKPSIRILYVQLCAKLRRKESSISRVIERMDLDDASRYVGGAVPRYWLVIASGLPPTTTPPRSIGVVTVGRSPSRSLVSSFAWSVSNSASSLPFPPPFSSSSPPPPPPPPSAHLAFSAPYRSLTLALTPCKVHGHVGIVRIVISNRGAVAWGKRAAFSSSLSFFSSPPSGRGGRREKSWWIFTRRGMVVRVGGRGESGSWQDSFTVPASR